MRISENTKKFHSSSDDGETEQITGVVENIVFHAAATGYTVCSAKIAGRKDNATVVGSCPAIWVGENFKAEGKWVRHKKHGFQFQSDTLVCIAPTSAKGIERYLASGMIKGIGKVNAKRLVKAFGDDTLRIIEKESKRLEEVEGIGPKRRKLIKESWNEQRMVRDIMIFLQGHGVGTAQSARIYRHYGNNAIAMITENPYRLCEEIWGIGFKTADGVAMSVGVPEKSEIRARAGLIHVLKTMTEEGHCFSTEPELILRGEDLLKIPAEILAEALNHEVAGGSLVKEDNKIYLYELCEAEKGIARKIKTLLKTSPDFKPIIVEKAVPWAEKNMQMNFAPMQIEALKTALSERVSIITGGPGVGKTTIIRALVDVFKKRKLTISLAAPTGRAAKRMEEATSHTAKTIHRMLKFMPKTGHFEHNASNPLEGDIFILDEASMIDVLLMNAFVLALPDKSCLILVGDIDQLPSVGPGNVLRDMIHSEAVPCRQLETIFRQDTGGSIVQNAHRINNGEQLQMTEGEDFSDFYFIEASEPDLVIKKLVDIVANRIPDKFGFNPMNDIQVLTPMRRNQLGADNLNAVLQDALNPSGLHVQRFGRKYRLGDRVMQIRNNYDKEIFNGDIGRIIKVDPVDQNIVVSFDGRNISFDFGELDELIHAYACSIHKSQGSEYPAVVILMTTQHFKLLQRNLLYTALTRGRKLACLLGSSKAVHIAIRNNEIRLRRTGLKERLKKSDTAKR
ncbi:ATP-dependent RecD-like DNA helicase [Verrucomicrobiota bacterium]